MIRFTLNARARRYAGPPFTRLIDVVREELRLTGTKEGCGEGECGACTVLVDGRAINSCLVPIVQIEGRRVETIEALGRESDLHLVQEAFLTEGAAQCGICTPGMVLAALTWLREGGGEDPVAIRRWLAGNLCRCTGYQHIVNAVIKAVRERRRHQRKVAR